MKTVDALEESKYFKIIYQKWINNLTNANHIKFGKVFFLGKKTNLDDNLTLEQFMVGHFNAINVS